MKEFNDFYVKERYMMCDATCSSFFRKDKGTYNAQKMWKTIETQMI